MNDIQVKLQQSLKKAVQDVFDLEIDENTIMTEIPKDTKNGDYSTNLAMKLTKQLHTRPQEIASKIIDYLNSQDDIYEKVEVAGVGFINFFMKKSEMANIINDIIDQNYDFGRNDIGNGKKVLVEYVSANPTGNLHVGHARGAAWGDSLTRILSFNGYDVLREYYINDAGNQIENLGLSLMARYRQLCGKDFNLPQDGYHGQDIIEIAQELYAINGDRYLQMDEKEALEFFKDYGKAAELDKIKKDLVNYRVEFDSWFSETSLYKNNLVEKVISDLREKDLVYDSEGAIWFKSTQFGDDKDRVLKKSDGSYTYLTPDIANHLNKIDRGYTKLINLWGADHHGYVPRMQNALYAFGYPKDTMEVDIIQMVRIVHHLEDGSVEEVKMSKRTGNAITLRDLCEMTGVDAARYFFVSKALDTHMDFDLDLATSQSNDNPVYYAQYAHARMCSILKKAPEFQQKEQYDLLNDEKEIALLKILGEFKTVVAEIGQHREVNKLCNYIQKLAASFHSFYNANKVVDENNMDLTGQRLALVNACEIVLRNALNLIGVEAVEVM